MSFPRYPAYKDSGVGWLGKVPTHWDVLKLGFLGDFKSGAGFPDEYQGQTDYEIPFYKVADLSRADADGALRAANHTISGDTARLLRARVFPVSTVIFAKIGAALLLQRYRWLGQPSCIDNNMMGLIVNERCAPRFLLYVLPLLDLSLIANPGAVPSINEEQISSQRVALPPLSEQTAIAAFLDHETAKIDALIAEQQQLIELLSEKRQALTSHGVTKGLNLSVPMKDSGVEWLGEVPEHWEVKRLKFVLSSIKAGPFGSSLTKDMYTESGVRIYGQEQVIPGDFTIGDYYISREMFETLRQYSIAPGDILISCVGTFGKIAIVPDDAELGIINPRLMRLRCTSDVMNGFLVDALRSSVTFEQFAVASRGGTMDVINIGTLNEIWIALPPMDEQRAIHIYLQSATARLDELTAEAQRVIELLQERRAALIAAAVTGQIDIRATANRTVA